MSLTLENHAIIKLRYQTFLCVCFTPSSIWKKQLVLMYECEILWEFYCQSFLSTWLFSYVVTYHCTKNLPWYCIPFLNSFFDYYRTVLDPYGMMAMLGFLVFLFYLIYNYLNATGSATSGRHSDLKLIILFGNSAYSKYRISFIQGN